MAAFIYYNSNFEMMSITFCVIKTPYMNDDS